MVINDLKRTCPRCKGSGHMPGFSMLGVNQINYDGRCPVCRGRGFTLTDLGDQLVRMLRPFVEEMIAESGRQPPHEPAEQGDEAGE